MSLGSFDKLTPLQETRCMLLDILVEYLTPTGQWVVWRRDPADILILADGNLVALSYSSPDEAIEDYVKNKDKYKWA